MIVREAQQMTSEGVHNGVVVDGKEAEKYIYVPSCRAPMAFVGRVVVMVVVVTDSQTQTHRESQYRRGTP
jgi:hypothetical protein